MTSIIQEIGLYVGFLSALVTFVALVITKVKEYLDYRRGQARSVNAYWLRVDEDEALTFSEDEKTKYTMPIKEAPRYRLGIVISNPSNAPIYDVIVYGVAYQMDNGARRKIHVLDDAGEPIKRSIPVETRLSLPTVPPGEFICFAVSPKAYNKSDDWPWAFPERLELLKTKTRPILNDPTWRVVELCFSDANGKRWRRGKRISGFTEGEKADIDSNERLARANLIEMSKLSRVKTSNAEGNDVGVYSWMTETSPHNDAS